MLSDIHCYTDPWREQEEEGGCWRDASCESKLTKDRRNMQNIVEGEASESEDEAVVTNVKNKVSHIAVIL